MEFSWIPLVVLVLSFPLFATDLSLCKSDAEKYCQGMSLTDAQIAPCLKGKQSSLTPGCKMALEDGKDSSRAVAEACGIDVKTHCGGVNKEGDHIKKCLHDHHSSLSHDCQATMPSAKDPFKGASPMDSAGAIFTPQGMTK